ncbi:MAG TPA: CDP-glucose 4,6-dehydratase [Terriglobales bacterium]|nr:CDP-glucose 4,6-dehydratase [Terriglobales bacterium]
MGESFGNFYRGKRVLVTGHTGFKGGWLTEWLKLLGAQVTGFALPPSTRPNLFDAIALDRGMTSIFGDVRDRKALAEVFADHQPEILIHLAGQSSIAKSQSDPIDTYAVNVMGTAHVLEEARYIRPLRAVVVAWSEPAYERPPSQEQPKPTEATHLSTWPLASSRSCAESVTAAYRCSFFSELRSAAVSSIRSGELVGGGDWAEDRLVPEVVRAISADEPLMIRRPDFLYSSEHVLESVRVCLMLGQRLYEEGQVYAQPWTLLPDYQNAVTVHEVAKRIVTEWGKGELVLQPDAEPGRGDSNRVQSSESAQARLRLGSKPALTLDQTLEWTVEWYREYYKDAASAWRMTQEQLQCYTDLMT